MILNSAQKNLALIGFLFFTTSCAFSPPFNGPQYSRETRALTGDPHREVVLALTNATLDGKQRSGFDSSSKKIFKNIAKFPGYIGGTVKVQIFGDEVWTMTIWEDEQSLQSFIYSTQHLDAMYMTNHAMKKFRHLHIKVRAKDLPYSWKQAEKLLENKQFQNHKPF